ncbi:MAG TPA: beta-eliminating lyase-related protein, partial [Bacillota bacterium]|nr:beta-eliminating lyase-related protein [Bacillota bacterium]
QSTEFGTVYTAEEIKAITDFAHANGLLVHMDGARLANAAAGLGVSLRTLTTDAGIDILSFGGAKNGLMLGEAVIFFNPELGSEFKYFRKQGMQLMAKMRFLAAQFDALLTDGLWLRNAQHANAMAQLLASELAQIPQVTITQKVQVNAVFAVIPPQAIPKIQERYYFYIWNGQTSEVRLMTSFDTTEADVRDFVRLVREIL